MATVRLTDTLKKDILRNADRLYDRRISAAREQPEGWGPIIRDWAVPKEHRDIIATLPDYYFTKGRELDISMPRNVLPEGIIPDGMFTLPVKVDFTGYVVPVSTSDRVDFTYYRVQFRTTVGLEDWLPKYRDWCVAHTKVEEQRAEFRKGVELVLNASATLAPALKAWPALWDLVPEEKKRKHKEVKPRSTTSKADAIGVDTAALTAAVTAAKFTR